MQSNTVKIYYKMKNYTGVTHLGIEIISHSGACAMNGYKME